MSGSRLYCQNPFGQRPKENDELQARNLSYLYSMRTEQAIDVLKSHGLRMTDTRVQIIEGFLGQESALHQRELESLLPEIDRITLYRNLKTFEEKGVIHKAVDSTQQQRYALCQSGCSKEAHQDDHIHFHCTACDRTICLDTKITRPTLPEGYTVENTHYAIDGLCPRCQ